MHSLETGVVVSIASFFFFSLLTFTFLRENSISNEIMTKLYEEQVAYEVGGDKSYEPEFLNNVLNIFIEEVNSLNGEDEE